MQYEVKNRWTGEGQFTAEIECDEGASISVKLGLAVRWARSSGANLRGANLRDANLRGAYLRGADLIDGGQRSDGYCIVGQIRDDGLWIHAGCRYFPIAEARAHWQKTRGGTALGDETFARLDMIEAVAKVRGLLDAKQEAA